MTWWSVTSLRWHSKKGQNTQPNSKKHKTQNLSKSLKRKGSSKILQAKLAPLRPRFFTVWQEQKTYIYHQIYHLIYHLLTYGFLTVVYSG
ncbi:hypothetical protein C2U48_24010 [Escherichia coli]|nr:hypothetical protein C2U48_24010 [Escherichia coli]EGD7681216.1 hypothetical protein [Escherichia coli]EGE3147716.1 hypothetical protein [Escherichia coli]EGE3784605.1 hypothetical protein [Escherichia coli]MHX18767.1 hypothetical protein [Escherichia coli]